jgi:hypothetical protein
MSGKKIVYHCYGGAHSSVAAAAIHLGELSPEKTPTEKELLELTLFDRQTKEGHGQLHFFGVDEWGNQIYSVGCRNAGQSFETVLKGVSDLLEIGEELVFVDTLHCVNIKMRVGGYISRRLGFISLGRPIVVRGTQEAYPQLLQLVKQIKADVSA